MRIFDTHAHYDDARFDGDREQVLAALPAAGVERVINPGCDLASSRKAVEYAERYGHVFAAVGFHPESIGEADAQGIEALRPLAAHEKVVAIGEIGLDYYWEKDEAVRARQREFFCAQMALAQELGLPVIVHDREAHGDAMEIVRCFPQVRGVFHCFSGSVETARELVERGWYISFTGVITFKGARRAAEVLQSLPPDRFFFETDSPYMAPEPHRGRRCDSRLLVHTLECAAALLGTDPQALAEQTMQNAVRLFGPEI